VSADSAAIKYAHRVIEACRDVERADSLWNVILKPHMEDQKKRIETAILEGKCESFEQYKLNCSELDMIKRWMDLPASRETENRKVLKE